MHSTHNSYHVSECHGNVDAQLDTICVCAFLSGASQSSNRRKLLVSLGSGVQNLDDLQAESDRRLQVSWSATRTRHMPVFCT
jgi:hypothetical protein